MTLPMIAISRVASGCLCRSEEQTHHLGISTESITWITPVSTLDVGMNYLRIIYLNAS